MRKHNKTFHIRFTESEYEKLCSLSERTGLPKSTYIRFMIKGQVPRDRPSPDYYVMTKQLYRIGTLLNQIAARVHTTGYIDAKQLGETIMMHRQALLDIQKAVLLPGAMDTETVLHHAKELEVLEEQTEPSTEPMVWDIPNNKEVDE
jgi:predicted DNA-binding protein